MIYDKFDLDIPRGKLISVFGPNGCGKSTLINMMAGLIPPDEGQILFDGMLLSEIKFGYVFQNYREALFPWLRAFDNIAYPLKLMKVPKAERRARVERLVAHLGVKLDLNRYPYEMSGGQQQLVSIMRALVVEPEILFLDEPFSALDYEMTLFMREQLQRIFMETGTTTVLVSHDLEEAVYLADRVLLLSRHPARVADFVPFDAPARDRSDTLSEPISSASRRIASRCSSARCAGHETPRPIPADRRRGRPDRDLVPRGLEQGRRPGAAAVADRCGRLRAVEGHERRQARASISCKRCSAPSCRPRSPSVIAIPLGIFLGSSEKALSLGRVRDRFLPLDAGLGDVSAVPRAVRRRRQDEDFGRGVRRHAGDPVQRRLRRDERAQDAGCWPPR